MRPERAGVAAAGTRRSHLRLLPRRPLRVIDVALFHGESTRALRAYLEAKVAFARTFDGIDHHLLVPGALGPGLPVNRADGYRLPLGGRGLLPALDALDPDVVLLHAPFWKAPDVCRLMNLKGAATVMVHHGFARSPGASSVYGRALRGWLHRTYDEADAVMAVTDPWEDTGRHAAIPLRFGIDAAFAPQPGVLRGDHVLHVGNGSSETGVADLLRAAARGRHGWRIRLAGEIADLTGVRVLAGELGLAQRLETRPAAADAAARAREYAAARCLVVPAATGSFELSALEAVACATPVVVAAGTPAAAALGARATAFRAGDAADLADAIALARRTPLDTRAAAELRAAHAWDRVLGQELRELERLVGW